MEPVILVERDCSALSGLFQIVINDMKGGAPVWDDFAIKATKFHAQLRATIAASTAYLDAFQKIADMATSTRGGTKDIGSALTRLCLRHRSVEARLKTFTSSVMDCLVLPLQDRLEEWKKTTSLLDKDHAKEFKRLRAELRKRGEGGGTLKLQKKSKHHSSTLGVSGLHSSLSKSMDSMEGSEKLFLLEEMEKKYVRRALIEERSRFCLLVNCMRPVVEEELAMLQEVTHLQEIMDALSKLTANPYALPATSELVIADLKLSSGDTLSSAYSQLNLHQTPPSSPSSFGSRKSSMCSISSYNSSSSGSTHSPSHTHSRSHTRSHSHSRYRSLSQPHVNAGPLRMSSISSQDSGFVSQPDNYRLHSNNFRTRTNTMSNIYSHPHPLMAKAPHSSSFEVSSLSEQSSGSAGNAAQHPAGAASGQWPDAASRPHTISTAYEKCARPSLSTHTFDPPTNGVSNQTCGSQECLVGASNGDGGEITPVVDNSGHQLFAKMAPVLPSRDATASLTRLHPLPDKPENAIRADLISSLPNYAGISLDQQGFYESQPIYANSASDWTGSDVAYSEGSITPTNAERSSSPIAAAREDDSASLAAQIIAEVKSRTAAKQALTAKANHPRSAPPTPPQRTSALSSEAMSARPPPASRPPAPYPKESQIYSSSGTLNRAGKPPPPPPVRRTSSISNPNAITLGTLRSAGCSTYEEIRTLKRNSHSTTHLDSFGYMDSEPIYCNIGLTYNTPSESSKSTTNLAGEVTYQCADEVRQQARALQSAAAALTSAVGDEQSGNKVRKEPAGEEETLPPPPPEAYCDEGQANSSANSQNSQTYNRISNIHRDFLNTLNAKLAVPQQQRLSPRLVKRRSMSVGEHDWDSDSGIVTGSSSSTTSSISSHNSQPHSLQQSLMRLMGHGTSHSSSRPSSASSTSRNKHKSPDPGRKSYTSFTLASTDRESLVQSINSRLALNPVQQSEVAKAAASIAAQKKHSVSDISSASDAAELYSNPYALSKAAPPAAHQPPHIRATQSQAHAQQAPLQAPPPPPQQQIYESVQHLQAMSQNNPQQRRSSQPIMGVKLSSARASNQLAGQPQPSGDTKASFLASLDAKLSQQTPNNVYQNPHSPLMQKRSSVPSDYIKKDDICMQQQANAKQGNHPAPPAGKTTVRQNSAGNIFSGAIENFETAIASRVNNWLTGRGSVDVISCRETLMDQIRQGKELKKVPSPNDRSEPKLA